MSQVANIKNVIEVILSHILDHPAQVEVTQGQFTDLYVIFPDASELGRVLGKRGRTIQAIRHLVYTMNCGRPNTKRTVITIDGAD